MTNAELIQKIRAEIERLVDEYKPIVGGVDELTGAHIVLAKLHSFLDTLESETTYDTQQYTPRPSVDIEDVARVQFASHAKVFDKKRKAVFDWNQFKEVAGIFYGFGKKDTLESEKPIIPDDAMKELDEKIALVKQRGTWDGVDVDKYMDEVRGREPENPVPKDLEQAADEMALRAFPEKKSYSTVIDRVVDYNAVDRKNYRDGIIAGAKWQKEQTEKRWLEDRDGCFWDGVALTWEDVKEIVRIADGMMYSADSLADIEKRLGIQPYYTEVLTRFKKFKEESHD